MEKGAQYQWSDGYFRYRDEIKRRNQVKILQKKYSIRDQQCIWEGHQEMWYNQERIRTFENKSKEIKQMKHREGK